MSSNDEKNESSNTVAIGGIGTQILCVGLAIYLWYTCFGNLYSSTAVISLLCAVICTPCYLIGRLFNSWQLTCPKGQMNQFYNSPNPYSSQMMSQTR